MSKVGRWVMASISAIILCMAVVVLLIYLRETQRPCADYTYQDAVEYVERNLSRNADPSIPDNFLANTMVCSTQNRVGSQQSGDPFIVNICTSRSENVVAYAEIYPDCGLEWRRR